MVAVCIYTCAKSLASKVCQQNTVRGPDFDFAFFQSQKLLFFVQKDKRFRWCEIENLFLGAVPTVEDLQGVSSCLYHYAFVELLKELYLSPCLVKADLHNLLTCVHINQSHGHTVLFNRVQ